MGLCSLSGFVFFPAFLHLRWLHSRTSANYIHAGALLKLLLLFFYYFTPSVITFAHWRELHTRWRAFKNYFFFSFTVLHLRWLHSRTSANYIHAGAWLHTKPGGLDKKTTQRLCFGWFFWPSQKELNPHCKPRKFMCYPLHYRSLLFYYI